MVKSNEHEPTQRKEEMYDAAVVVTLLQYNINV